jgi:hypothetical protein
MAKYVYKNEVGRPINIGGYQFQKDGELPSDIIIDRFREAVSNSFLSLEEFASQGPYSGTDTENKARKAVEAE